MVGQPPSTEATIRGLARQRGAQGGAADQRSAAWDDPGKSQGQRHQGPKKRWIFPGKIMKNPYPAACWVCSSGKYIWGTSFLFFSVKQTWMFLSTGIDMSINGWDVTGRKKSMFHGIFRSKTPATIERFFWIQWKIPWNSSIGFWIQWNSSIGFWRF